MDFSLRDRTIEEWLQDEDSELLTIFRKRMTLKSTVKMNAEQSKEILTALLTLAFYITMKKKICREHAYSYLRELLPKSEVDS